MRAATGRPYDTAAPCPIAPSLPPRLTAPSRRCAPSRSDWLRCAAACVDRLAELGVTIKDLDLGLLDFPSERDGAEVLLCWHVGEETVSTWHGLAEGYAGRKPIDWDE